MIPNEIIDQILDKTDIVEIISQHVQLKRAGQNFKACCPFHQEKTPSFMVSRAKQIYHCFGCGAGGNVIGFLMNHEKMDFIDAIKILSDKTGIALPRSNSSQSATNTLADKMYNANDIACGFYEENLTKEYGASAHQYFVRRGITERIRKHFRLGYAVDSWQGILNFCKAKNVTPEVLQKTGLILKNDTTGNIYDRFRNRVMFPIFDVRGRVLGFGARALDDSLPKYLNSPETHIYKKGRQLYGLNFAKDAIRKQNYVVIVEGYFDIILPFQNEIKNIVATLGTALTPEQIGALKRFTKNVIMVYDADQAGQAATLRGLDLLIEEEMNVRIAILPKGKDPDSFVREKGRAEFIKVLKDSKDLFDYKLGTLTAKFKSNEPQGKARIIGEMLPTLAKIKNAVLQSGYLKKMAEELQIDEESIRSEIKKINVGGTRSFSRPKEIKETVKYKSATPAELTLLAIALEDPHAIKEIEEKLSISTFSDVSVRRILDKVRELESENRKIMPSHLMSSFDDKRIEGIISEAVGIAETIQDKERVFGDCLRHIKTSNLKDSLKVIQLKIKEASRTDDTAKVDSLVAEYSNLIKEIGKIAIIPKL